MNKEELLSRIQMLSKQLSESADNHQRIKTALDNSFQAHNILFGRCEELKEQYAKLVQEEQDKNIKSAKG